MFTDTMWKDTMFTAALFIIAKTWKQYKCPSMNKDVVHICSGMLATKNEIMSFPATWVGPRDYHTK